MINLIPIFQEKKSVLILYDLLKERTPEQSISHKKMPNLIEHTEFVRRHPYQAWYLIQSPEDGYVGSIYLTRRREIGVFVFNAFKGHGYGTHAIKEIMAKWPGKFFANVNPDNKDSMRFFSKLGDVIQVTYEIF